MGKRGGGVREMSAKDLLTCGNLTAASLYEMFSCDITSLIDFCLEYSGHDVSMALWLPEQNKQVGIGDKLLHSMPE